MTLAKHTESKLIGLYLSYPVHAAHGDRNLVIHQWVRF